MRLHPRDFGRVEQTHETQYAKSGDVTVAYEVVGDGPFDLIHVPGFVSNIELAWHVPVMAEFFRHLASFSRLIQFDKRGTGMSDRNVGLPDLETRMDDVRAVMDAAGSGRAALLGASEGGPMSALFAATYPERTSRGRPTSRGENPRRSCDAKAPTAFAPGPIQPSWNRYWICYCLEPTPTRDEASSR
jgi:pimeloyl-ACP methyl ester carboxylesterase